MEKEEWIYFTDNNELGKLFRMKTDGSEKEALPISHVEQWYIGEDKIIYSTLRDWDKIQIDYDKQPTSQRFFINEFYMMNLDGSNQVRLADETVPLQLEGEEDLAISFRPFFIKNGKIYVEVTFGIPYTDAISHSIYTMNQDGTDFRLLSEQGYFYMSGYYFTDKYVYFSQNHYEQLSPLCRMDLITGQYTYIGHEVNLVGEYDGFIYYTDQVLSGSENIISLYKLPVNSIEAEYVCEISKTYYLAYMAIINHKFYFSYYPEGKYEYRDLIKKEVDLNTKSMMPIAPDQEDYLYMSHHYKQMKDQEGYIYYAPYDKEELVATGMYKTQGIYKMNSETHQREVIEAGVDVYAMQVVELIKHE